MALGSAHQPFGRSLPVLIRGRLGIAIVSWAEGATGVTKPKAASKTAPIPITGVGAGQLRTGRLVVATGVSLALVARRRSIRRR